MIEGFILVQLKSGQHVDYQLALLCRALHDASGWGWDMHTVSFGVDGRGVVCPVKGHGICYKSPSCCMAQQCCGVSSAICTR